MNTTAAASTTCTSENATDSSRIVPSKAESIALCTAFIFTSIFIVVGNLLTIVLFAVNRRLRKRSLFLVINMACADQILGTVSLPISIYSIGGSFKLWKNGWKMSLRVFFTTFDIVLSQAR